MLSAGAELVYDAEAYVVHEDTTVVVTRDGWIKRLGEIKDPGSTRVREGDLAKWILRGNTRDNLALFSNFGVVYVLKVANVPATTGYGEPVQSLLNFKDGERVIAAALVTRPAKASPAPTAGRAGWSPRRAAWASSAARISARPPRAAAASARTKEGDEVLVVAAAEGDTITAATAGSKVLAFPADELPELSGVGRGVILMRVDKGDRLIGAVCHPLRQPPIAVAEDGSERRFHLPEIAHRAQKGRKALKRFKPAELVARPTAGNAGVDEETLNHSGGRRRL